MKTEAQICSLGVVIHKDSDLEFCLAPQDRQEVKKAFWIPAVKMLLHHAEKQMWAQHLHISISGNCLLNSKI